MRLFLVYITCLFGLLCNVEFAYATSLSTGIFGSSNNSTRKALSLAANIYPVGWLSMGYSDPVGPLVQSTRTNDCIEGATLKTVIEASPLDFPINNCEISLADNQAAYPFVDSATGTTKWLEFGGMFGNGKDFATSNPDNIIRYNNPYSGIPNCDLSKGFEAYKVYGSYARDYGILACYAIRNSESELTYSDKIYGGVTQDPNTCTASGMQASQIFGTIGSLVQSQKLDPDLYLCHGQRQSTGGDVHVVGYRLLGFNDRGANNYNIASGYENLSNGTQIPINLYQFYSIEILVEENGQLLKASDYPATGSTPPFKLKVDLYKNGSLMSDGSFFENYPLYVTGRDNQETNEMYAWVRNRTSDVGLYGIAVTPVDFITEQPVGPSSSLMIEFVDQTAGSPDITAPTKPTNLSVTSTSSSSICLSWSASTDPQGAAGEIVTGVSSYELYVNNSLKATLGAVTSGCASNLSADTSYTLKIRAKDGAGNLSPFSNNLNQRTDTNNSNPNSNLPEFDLAHYVDIYNQDWGYDTLLSQDSNGWSIPQIAAGNKTIYVSSSSGSDSASGLSANSPVKTINKAFSLAQSLSNVQAVAFARGDTWTLAESEEFPWRDFNGRSKDELFYVMDYGNTSLDRPHFKVYGKVFKATGSNFNNRAYIGLHFEAMNIGRDSGIHVLVDFPENLLFEDCRFEGFFDNLKVSGYGNANGSNYAPGRNLIIRRNEIFGSASYGLSDWHNRNQGLYSSKFKGVFISENIFYNNGKHLDPAYNVNGIAKSSVYSHGVYLQYSVEDIITWGNIAMDNGSHGIQQRPGGIMASNLFLANPHAFLFNHSDADRPSPKPNGTVAYNVVIDSGDIHPEVCVNCKTNSDGTTSDVSPQKRSHCMDIHPGKDLQELHVTQNMCLQQKLGTSGNQQHPAITLFNDGDESANSKIFIEKNLVYKWNNDSGIYPLLHYKRDSSGTVQNPIGQVFIRNNMMHGFISFLNNSGQSIYDRLILSQNQSPLAVNSNINYDLSTFMSDVSGQNTMDGFIEYVANKRRKGRYDPNFTTDKLILRVRQAYQQVMPQP